MVAYQESEHRRDGRPHGQALLRTCRLRQQPHRDAGERRRGGRMGDPRHGLRDAVGRTDAADERQRPKTSTATTPSSSRSPTPFRCNASPKTIFRWPTSRPYSSATRSSTTFGARPTPTSSAPTPTNAGRKTRTATSSPPRATSITTTGSSTPTPRATRSANGGFRTACSYRRSRGTATA